MKSAILAMSVVMGLMLFCTTANADDKIIRSVSDYHPKQCSILAEIENIAIGVVHYQSTPRGVVRTRGKSKSAMPPHPKNRRQLFKQIQLRNKFQYERARQRRTKGTRTSGYDTTIKYRYDGVDIRERPRVWYQQGYGGGPVLIINPYYYAR